MCRLLTTFAGFAALCGACSLVPRSASESLSGSYANSDTIYEFKSGKVFQYMLPERNLVYEAGYLVKGNKVYIAPSESDRKIMIRNVWCVYRISGNKLIASHLEDMDTGDVFYKDKKPRIILRKQ